MSYLIVRRCVLHATILNSRAEAYHDMLEGDLISEMALHNPQLVKVSHSSVLHMYLSVCVRVRLIVCLDVFLFVGVFVCSDQVLSMGSAISSESQNFVRLSVIMINFIKVMYLSFFRRISLLSQFL